MVVSDLWCSALTWQMDKLFHMTIWMKMIVIRTELPASRNLGVNWIRLTWALNFSWWSLLQQWEIGTQNMCALLFKYCLMILFSSMCTATGTCHSIPTQTPCVLMYHFWILRIYSNFSRSRSHSSISYIYIVYMWQMSSVFKMASASSAFHVWNDEWLLALPDERKHETFSSKMAMCFKNIFTHIYIYIYIYICTYISLASDGLVSS